MSLHWDHLDGVPLEQVTRFISKTDAGYWFWDETGAEALGPYATKKAASKALNKYVAWLNGDNDEVPKPRE